LVVTEGGVGAVGEEKEGVKKDGDAEEEETRCRSGR